MTAPSPQDPWPPPIVPQPATAGRRRLHRIDVLVLSILVLLVCGTLGVVGAIAGPGPRTIKSTSHAANPATRPHLVAPATSLAAPSAEPALLPTQPTLLPATTTPPPPTTAAAAAAPTHKSATKPKAATKPKPKPKPKPKAPAVRSGVHPGAFCSPEGALGRTSKGTLMQCKPSATDDRNRWRKA